jgi:DNA-binding MarR family transcriptional regulator
MDGEVMSDNSFFKPTLLYKEFMILDLIEKDANITQREISKTIGVAVSMVNQYLDDYEKENLIKKKKYSTKKVEYLITKAGKERKRFLNIQYLHAAQKLYDEAKKNIVDFLINQLSKKTKSLILYGAGEVSSIIIETIRNNHIDLDIPFIIDDDLNKHGKTFNGIKVCEMSKLNQTEYDAVLVSSYSYHRIMYEKLLKQVDKNKIISYFG